MAEAKKRRRGKKPAAAAKINKQALSELMGPYKFGMTKADILKILDAQLEEKYQDKIKETTDVYQQDSLRRKKRAEFKKIKDSYREFEGKKTGWDVSIIDDQFGHKTSEAMLVFWENNASGQDQRRFFFFHEGSLYKMFIALDADMLPANQRNFDSFHELMNRRYGEGQLVTRTKRNGEEVPVLVDWQSRSHHVQALDKLSFYGSFCLVIADPSVERVVASARDANRVEKPKNAVIEAMLEGDDDAPPSLDANKAAVDSIVNKRR